MELGLFNGTPAERQQVTSSLARNLKMKKYVTYILENLPLTARYPRPPSLTVITAGAIMLQYGHTLYANLS